MAENGWDAQRRFGSVAGGLRACIGPAVLEAHRRALAAHVASGLRSNDAYGSSLWVCAQEEVNAAARRLDGVELIKPSGLTSRFPLPVVRETGVGLFVWRYAVDTLTSRADARLRRSELRTAMLAAPAAPAARQLDLEEHALLDEVTLARQLDNEHDLFKQLSERGRFVIIGFASNPSMGVVGLGWGDAVLVDPEEGLLEWSGWEALPLTTDSTTTAADAVSTPHPPQPRRGEGPRFDEAPMAEVELVALPPLSPVPITDPPRQPAATGSDDTVPPDGEGHGGPA